MEEEKEGRDAKAPLMRGLDKKFDNEFFSCNQISLVKGERDICIEARNRMKVYVLYNKNTKIVKTHTNKNYYSSSAP